MVQVQDMTHIARSKIHNAVTSIRRGYRSGHQEEDEHFVGNEGEDYWDEDTEGQQESSDPSGVRRNPVQRSGSGLEDYLNQESAMDRFRHRFGSKVERPTRLFGDFLHSMFGLCNGVGDTASDWNCSNVKYRVPPASYDHGISKGPYDTYHENGHGKACRRERRSVDIPQSKAHHNMMDVLQERIIRREGAKDECFYAQRHCPYVDYNAVFGPRRRDQQNNISSSRVSTSRREETRYRNNNGHNKNETKMHSEDMNVAGKLPCKLSEVRHVLPYESSSGPLTDTPTLLLNNVRQGCLNNTTTNAAGYPLIINEDDKSLETFAYDDGISVLSAHTLEEMAKIETKRKNSASEHEPLEEGFDIIIQVESKEMNHKDAKKKYVISDPMIGVKGVSEGDMSQPPSPVGTEGSDSTDNTNNRSQQGHTPEGKKMLRDNMQPPPPPKGRSNSTMTMGTDSTIPRGVRPPYQYPLQMRRDDSVLSKKTNTSSFSSFADFWKGNEVQFGDGVVNDDEKDQDKTETKEERNGTTTAPGPITPKRNNRHNRNDIHTGDQEDAPNQQNSEIVTHRELSSTDGAGKRKKKSRSRVPFFGRWNAVEYMQCVEDDVM